MKDWEYVRQINRNYLQIPCMDKDIEKLYQYHMLTANRISGLIPCSVRMLNGRHHLFYDITSLQNLKSIYIEKKISINWLFDFAFAFRQAVKSLEEHLLKAENILLQPELMFQDLDSGTVLFLYYPYADCSGEENLRSFIDFLTADINHEDDELVELVYWFYERAMETGDISCMEELYTELKKRQKIIPNAEPHIELKTNDWKNGQATDNRNIREKENSNQDIRVKENSNRDIKAKESSNQDIRAKENSNQYLYLRGEKNNQEINSYIRAEEIRRDCLSAEWDIKDSNVSVWQKSEDKGRSLPLVIGSCIIFIAAAGAAVFYVYANYDLQPTAAGLFWGGLILATAIMAAWLYRYLDRSRTPAKEEAEGLNEMSYEQQNIANKNEEETGMENEEWYGRTMYFEPQGAENKLYGIGRYSKKTLQLHKFPYTIGKKKDYVDGVIRDDSVSRMHARFIKKENSIYIEDLNSTNGTFKNGLPLKPHEMVVIAPEDELRFGKAQFYYR